MDLKVKNFKGERVEDNIFFKIREIIANQLGFFVKSFIIKQAINDRYYLLDIHYRYYNTKYSCLRGSIVDMKENKFFLVSDVLPNEEVVYTKLKDSGRDSNVVYYKGYDGCVLRIFELDGKIVYSTNRCIDTRNNKIFSVKDSRTFEQIMRQVAKVDDASEKAMFEADNKDKIHFFLIVTRETYLFMQGEIEEKVFYIGSKSKYETGSTKKLDLFRNFCDIKHFEPITTSEANKILGFEKKNLDPRLDMENSGFVVRETRLPYSKTFLYSQGYDWRKSILGLKRSDKITNIYLELRKFVNDIPRYKELFPYIRIVREGNNILVKSEKYPEYLTKQQLEENLINCLYLILPKTRKLEVFTLQNHIKDKMQHIAKLIKEHKIPMDKIYNRRIKEFIERASNKNEEGIVKLMEEETDGETVYLLGRILELFD